MIKREEHLKQINRFHDRIEEIDKQLDAIPRDDYTDEHYLLAREYYHMSKLWSKIDDFIEFELKHNLDNKEVLMGC